MLIKNRMLILTLCVIFFLILLFNPSVQTAYDAQKNSSGPSFSDPFAYTPMSEEWQKQPVKYNPSDSEADIVITLDGQMYLAWEPIINKFASDNNLKIVIKRGTCGFSAGGLLRKSIDIGAFCCPPGETDRLPGLKYHTAGIAALVLIVHPENPVDNITLDQAREVFRGNIYRWSDLGGKQFNHLIRPVARLHCKIRPGHWRRLLDNKDLFGSDVFEVGAMPDMINQVSLNPGAIGHEVIWTTRYYSGSEELKFLKINGYAPDVAANVISLKYPLYRVYSFTTWEGKDLENVKAHRLVEYLLGEAGRLDGKFHLIPASELRKAGWKFKDDELIGEPG